MLTTDEQVQFDYKKDHRLNWIWSITIMIMMVIFVALPSFTYSYFGMDYSVMAILNFYPTVFYEIGIPTVPLILYIALMSNLRKRFEVLNSILRFENACLFYKKKN